MEKGKRLSCKTCESKNPDSESYEAQGKFMVHITCVNNGKFLCSSFNVIMSKELRFHILISCQKVQKEVHFFMFSNFTKSELGSWHFMLFITNTINCMD